MVDCQHALKAIGIRDMVLVHWKSFLVAINCPVISFLFHHHHLSQNLEHPDIMLDTPKRPYYLFQVDLGRKGSTKDTLLDTLLAFGLCMLGLL